MSGEWGELIVREVWEGLGFLPEAMLLSFAFKFCEWRFGAFIVAITFYGAGRAAI